jgi:hypothetical protein
MAGELISVPGSLQKYPETSTPFELHLHVTPSTSKQKWRGWTTDEAKGGASITYRLPLPERNLGAVTELNFQDEDSYYASPDVVAALGRRGVEITAAIASKIDSNLLGLREIVLGLQKGLGGDSVPLDLSALTVYGTKKRSYLFNFELFSYDINDGKDISKFVYNIHGHSTVVSINNRTNLATPSIFTFDIFSKKERKNVTDLWYPSPLPCAMVSFQHTPTDFIQTIDGSSSARAICTMQLTEIEPASFSNGKFSTIWEVG